MIIREEEDAKPGCIQWDGLPRPVGLAEKSH